MMPAGIKEYLLSRGVRRIPPLVSQILVLRLTSK